MSHPFVKSALEVSASNAVQKLFLDHDRPESLIKHTRAVLNAVVGNPTAKRAYVDAGAADALVHVLYQQLTSHPGRRSAAAPAAAALGSIACRFDVGASDVVRAGGPLVLIHALFSSNSSIIQASARALKVLLDSSSSRSPTCSAILRDQRALQSSSTHLPQIGHTREQVFANCHHSSLPAVARIVAILREPDLMLSKICANILSAICSNRDDAILLESVGVVPALLSLLKSSSGEECNQAVLAALVPLARHGSVIAAQKPLKPPTLDIAVTLMRSPNPEMRLLASTFVVNIILSANHGRNSVREDGHHCSYCLHDEAQQANFTECDLTSMERMYLPPAAMELIKLIEAKNSLDISIKSVQAITRLASNSRLLQQMICDMGVLKSLKRFLSSLTDQTFTSPPRDSQSVLTTTDLRFYLTNPAVSIGMEPQFPNRWHSRAARAFEAASLAAHSSESTREPERVVEIPFERNELDPINLAAVCEPVGTCLNCIAALCSSWEPAREQCMEAGLLPLFVSALEQASNSVVLAALKCIRSISRSVEIVSRDFGDSNISPRILHLVESGSLELQRQASACICNLILDFSPTRPSIVEESGIAVIARQLEAEDKALQFYALEALKNAAFNAHPSLKSEIRRGIGYRRLASLCLDNCDERRAMALELVENLTRSSSITSTLSEINSLFLGMGDKTLEILETVLLPSSPLFIVETALYVVCNIASGTEVHKNILSMSRLPEEILGWSANAVGRVRLAATWCMYNLCCTEERALLPDVFDRTNEQRLVRRVRLPHEPRDVSHARQEMQAVNLDGAAPVDASQIAPTVRVPDCQRIIAQFASNVSYVKNNNVLELPRLLFGGARAMSDDSMGDIPSAYVTRMSHLRELGFERRLVSLLDDVDVEVVARARQALRLFDSSEGPVEETPTVVAPDVESTEDTPSAESSSDEMLD